MVNKVIVKKKKKLRFSQQLMLVVLILMGAAFLPVATTLMIGMLPAIVCMMVDTTHQKTRSVTVGLLNFVACFPFLMIVAIDNPTMAGTVAVLSEPLNIIIMYAGAAAGYSLDWTCAGLSNIVMTTRARQRLEAIKRYQDDMIRRWGQEVTGDIPLDPSGFPLNPEEETKGAGK
jgi:hypothetical protein